MSGSSHIISDVDNRGIAPIPGNIILHQNRPNPFNMGTTIAFSLPRAGYAELKIFNLLGEVVAAPVARYLSAGEHRVVWDGKDMAGNPTATGVYIYLLKSEGYSSAKKMILLK